MMHSEYIYPALVLVTGYLVLGITGFGSALVVVPLLAKQWPLPEVVALAILLDIPASILHGGLNLKQVQWAELRQLLPGMAIGTLVGLWLLGALDRRWPLFFLGLYVVFVGIRALLPRHQAPGPTARGWAYFAGTLIGVIEVMFATAGPAVVAWLQRRADNVGAVRATVPVVMVLAGSIAVGVLFGTGKIDPSVIGPRWLLGVPIALSAVALGNRVAGRIPIWFMRRILAVLLTISGLSLMQHVLV